MDQENRRLEYGKEHILYTTTFHILGGGKKIRAVYLGYIPPKKQDRWFTDGWGHLFFREMKEN